MCIRDSHGAVPAAHPPGLHGALHGFARPHLGPVPVPAAAATEEERGQAVAGAPAPLRLRLLRGRGLQRLRALLRRALLGQ